MRTFEGSTVMRSRYLYRPVGTKPGHRGEWGEFVEIGDCRAAVGAQLIADSVVHQHFAVQTVEGTQTKIAVAQ